MCWIHYSLISPTTSFFSLLFLWFGDKKRKHRNFNKLEQNLRIEPCADGKKGKLMKFYIMRYCVCVCARARVRAFICCRMCKNFVNSKHINVCLCVYEMCILYIYNKKKYSISWRWRTAIVFHTHFITHLSYSLSLLFYTYIK